MDDLMKYKKNEWQELQTDAEKAMIIGKLEAYKDCVDYLNTMRECLTRLLLVNDVKEEEYDTLKKRYSGIKGLDNEYDKDDDGDHQSFHNC